MNAQPATFWSAGCCVRAGEIPCSSVKVRAVGVTVAVHCAETSHKLSLVVDGLAFDANEAVMHGHAGIAGTGAR